LRSQEVVLDLSVARADLLLLTISSADNHWTFRAAFEALLLLKNLLLE
jgi:hypothetical protein